MDEYILEMDHINKSFPGVKALNDVNFKVRDREIHGLVGENGAGKSTLTKILAGLYKHDSGNIRFCGVEYDSLTAKRSEQIGISFIHQDLQTVPYLSVAESLYLGIEPTFTKLRLMNRKKMEKMAAEFIFEKLKFHIDGSRVMKSLSVGEQQLVQICRALLTNPKLIVFDESTAVLAKKECDILFGIIRELGRRISIVYISHYLKEILDLCDRVTVLRNGENVDTFRTKGKTVEDLVLSMVGRGVGSLFPARNSSLGEPLISVKNFSRDNFFKNVNFEIRRGEILGLTGLMGSGHVCVGQSLYYGGKGIRGDVLLNGVRVGDTDPERSVGRGFAFVPEDRHRLGVLQQISVKENITLSNLHNICNKGIIDAGKERGISLDLISKLNIKTPSEEQTAGLLSGGNQQKVVIARWLCNGSSFFILNQPTSGVDVGARLEIYNHIRDLASEGAAILLISQDIQELVGLSDRVIIMYRGEIADELDTGEDISDRVIVSMAGGGQNVA